MSNTVEELNAELPSPFLVKVAELHNSARLDLYFNKIIMFSSSMSSLNTLGLKASILAIAERILQLIGLFGEPKDCTVGVFIEFDKAEVFTCILDCNQQKFDEIFSMLKILKNSGNTHNSYLISDTTKFLLVNGDYYAVNCYRGLFGDIVNITTGTIASEEESLKVISKLKLLQ